MHPDQKYIDALVNKDIKLLEEVYRKCFPLIKITVLQKNGTEADAKDMFHESLIDLFKKAKTQPFTLTSSICAYLRGMCTHKWLDELKKRNREEVTFGGFEGHDNTGEDCFQLAEEHYLKQARLNLIGTKFKELGETCKALLRLSWTRDASGKRRTTEEIAGMLNITDGYARKKKSECIVRLIKLVMDDPEFGNLKR